MKRTIAFLLIIILVLSMISCSTVKEKYDYDEQFTTSFSVKEKVLPYGGGMNKVLSAGEKLFFVSVNPDYSPDKADSAEFVLKEYSADFSLTDSFGVQTDKVFVNDGGIYCLFPDGEQAAITRYDYEHNFVEKIPLPMISAEEAAGVRYFAVTDESVFLLTFESLTYYDRNNGKTNRAELGLIKDYCISDDTLYVIYFDNGDNYLSAYSFDGRRLFEEKSPYKDSNYKTVSYSRKDGIIYLVDGYNVKIFSPDGVEIQTIYDLRRYENQKFKPSPYQFVRFSCVSADNTLLLFLSDGDEITVLELVPDDSENVKTEVKPTECELKIFVPFKNSALNDAAFSYMNEHPETKITVTEWREEFISINDFRQYVSVNMLGGEGEWDIMDVSLLPFCDYAEKVYITNLETIGGADVLSDGDRYFLNIFDGVRCADGGLYAFPVGFVFDVIKGDNLSEEETLWDCFDALPEKSVYFMNFTNKSPEVSLLLHSYAGCFIDERTKTFNEDALRDAFIKTKSLFNGKKLTEDYSAEVQWFSINNVNSLSRSLNGETKTLLPLPIGEKTVNKYDVQTMFSISEESENKEAALDFLVYLSDKCYQYIPVSKIALKDQFGLSDEEYDSVSKIISGLDYGIPMDSDLYAVISSALDDYIKDKITLDGALGRVENAAELYFGVKK